jgi:hypothetical protein
MVEDLPGLSVVTDLAATPSSPSFAPAAQGWGGRGAGLPAGEALGLFLMVILAWLFLQALRLADRRSARARTRRHVPTASRAG